MSDKDGTYSSIRVHVVRHVWVPVAVSRRFRE
jgi:hypothetical protein